MKKIINKIASWNCNLNITSIGYTKKEKEKKK